MLNLMKMNSGYVKSQREMHPTNTNQEVGYLGPHERIIEVEYEKHMVFQEGGNVQFWNNPQDCVVTKFSQYDEPQLKDKTKSKLHGNRKSDGVDISIVKGKRVVNMHNIPP